MIFFPDVDHILVLEENEEDVVVLDEVMEQPRKKVKQGRKLKEILLLQSILLYKTFIVPYQYSW